MQGIHHVKRHDNLFIDKVIGVDGLNECDLEIHKYLNGYLPVTSEYVKTPKFSYILPLKCYIPRWSPSWDVTSSRCFQLTNFVMESQLQKKFKLKVVSKKRIEENV